MKTDRKIDFEKGDGLVPAVVQDARTGAVLMLGYMNEEALEKTHETGRVTFFSRSKSRLWTKGETSGNFLLFQELLIDCDGDTLLIKALPQGPACHTGDDTCFAEKNLTPPDSERYLTPSDFLGYLVDVIRDRCQGSSEKSYTSALFAKGIEAVAQKVGEEATEVVIAALREGDKRVAEEAADLLFHLLVLLEAKQVPFSAVMEVLRSRHQASRLSGVR